MENDMNIRDLIYFDTEKAASIWSQTQGGLLERISISEETSKEDKGGATIGIPHLLELEKGLLKGSKGSILETKILHHDLLNRLDSELNKLNLVVNINKDIKKNESNPQIIREAIGTKPYVQAEGWAVLEDYRKISKIASRFNEIIEFVKRCTIQNIPEYKDLQKQIDVAKEQANLEKNRNKRSIILQKIKTIESTIKGMLKINLDNKVDDWLLEGIQKWIEIYMANRINFRIYPIVDCPSFQILCNLKTDCFVDQDLEHLLYGYGYRPNIPLTAFGLITSIPSQSELQFDPMTEFKDNDKLTDKAKLEKAFRDMFSAMDAMEDYVRYSRYPNITIHPIAVFRNIKCIK